MSYFRDRTALVVGASEGIGRAVALALAARGARVVAASRSLTSLEGLRVEQVDVCRPDSVAGLASRLASDPPWLLINCAGLALPGYLAEIPVEELRSQMELNYFGTVNLVHAFLPSFLARGSGHIVMTSSLAGLFGLSGYTGYCASKFAVVGFCQALRRELASRGIRVSVLCPPNTRTPGLERENLRKPPEVLKAEEKVATVSAEFVAEKLLRALPGGREVIIPTFDGTLAWYLSRWAPRLLDRFL